MKHRITISVLLKSGLYLIPFKSLYLHVRTFTLSGAHTSLRHSPVTADRSMFPASAVSHLPVTFQDMAPITPPLS